MHTVIETKEYRKALKVLGNAIPTKAVRRMMTLLATIPQGPHPSIKKLTEFQPPYRYRLGDYRVFYKLEEETVYLIDIRHRQEAYKKR